MKRFVHDINSSRFHYNKETGVISIDISDLGRDVWMIKQPLYYDMAGEGLAIKSNVTGCVVRYFLHRAEMDEGDTLYWEYLPVPSDMNRYKESAGTKVLIFND